MRAQINVSFSAMFTLKLPTYITVVDLISCAVNAPQALLTFSANSQIEFKAYAAVWYPLQRSRQSWHEPICGWAWGESRSIECAESVLRQGLGFGQLTEWVTGTWKVLESLVLQQHAATLWRQKQRVAPPKGKRDVRGANKVRMEYFEKVTLEKF